MDEIDKSMIFSDNTKNNSQRSFDENIENADPEKFTILYIDDNKELLDNISDYLSETYNVITATNGKIGFEKGIALKGINEKRSHRNCNR